MLMSEQHVTEKRCSICGETKPLDVFENDARRPLGKGPRCKPCVRVKTAERKKAMREEPINRPSAEQKHVDQKPHQTVSGKPEVRPTNMCRCGAYLLQHDAELKCAKTGCGGYVH
jgi:hypothetical protein